MRIVADQIGYLPGARKLAVLLPEGAADAAQRLVLVRASDKARMTDVPVVLAPPVFDETAGEAVRTADFSAHTEAGTYYLEAADGTRSHAFTVAPHVYRDVKHAILRALYFQRCGEELQERFAGVYARRACHLRDAVFYEDRTKRITLRGGWHDAGDFGRYPSAAATALAHLLYAYELFPECFAQTWNLPESGNGTPDLLNECRVELNFLLQMQAADGGVYHKVTTLRHPDFLMPHEDDGELLVFPVSSVATASFAAVFCAASRVYADVDPGFARLAMHAAQAAGQWLLDHPENVEFHNPPDCNTGDYTDEDDRDERLWAFVELLRTDVEMFHEGDHSHAAAMPLRETRQEKYRRQIAALWETISAKERKMLAKYDADIESPVRVAGFDPILSDGFGWEDVTAFAFLAALFDPDARVESAVREEMRKLLFDKTERLVREQEGSAFRLAMRPRDFVWGSNMVVTNRADLLLLAALLDKENAPRYEVAALEQLHYLFGRNAADVSFVTGFGEGAYRHPHNRVTECDGVDDPIPGEVSGGPCFPPRDPDGERLVPAGSAPQKCYTDDAACYSLNEITIYWNSSAAFAAAYFDGD